MISLPVTRLAYMALTLLLVSFVSFVIIQAAPGDYAEIYAAKKAATGAIITQADIEAVRIELGLDRPWYVQYWRWLSGALHGDFGFSWAWRRPVGEVIGERMPLTLAIAFSTLFFMYAVSIPIGIYSAVHRYSFGDHAVSMIGYLGLAIPNFLLALVLMYLTSNISARASAACSRRNSRTRPGAGRRFKDFARASRRSRCFVLGTAGTAFLIRAMRAAVLDELDKMYVLVGQGERPVADAAAHPLSGAHGAEPDRRTLGWRLTYVISGRADRRLRAGAAGHRAAVPECAAQPGHVSRRRADLHLLRADRSSARSSPTCCWCCSIRASGWSDGDGDELPADLVAAASRRAARRYRPGPRQPMAADVVEVPPATRWRWSGWRCSACSSCDAVRRDHRPLSARPAQPELCRRRADACRISSTQTGALPPAAVRLRPQGGARHGHAAHDLRGRHARKWKLSALRARRALQAARA